VLTWPNIEVSETGKEVKVRAELPGLEEQDVEVAPFGENHRSGCP
jgi:HSP20 family molecular chaperone IbpA